MKHDLAVGLFVVTCAFCGVSSASDALVDDFRTPPSIAQPRAWWHWMNGNVTEEGIKSDLEWMKRVGIGGVQNFDVDLHTPRIVKNRLAYLTPEWRRAFRYALSSADGVGMEFAIAGSPGWSETGGPWVKPEQAMKKLVWSETRLEGSVPFNGVLTRPPAISGPFQDISMGKEGQHRDAKSFYADAAVIAYRAPASDVPLEQLQPNVTSSAGTIDGTRLMDGDLSQVMSLSMEEEIPWIQYSFATAQRIQALTIAASRSGGRGGIGPQGWLEVSEDGKAFRKIADLPHDGAAKQQTISFPPSSARYFRVLFMRSKHETRPDLFRIESPKSLEIAELVLHTAARVNRFEDKAGWGGQTFDSSTGLYHDARPITEEDSTPLVAKRDVIPISHIVDLTERLRPDGSLTWTPPAGRWVVLRLGYSLTGKTNHPASSEGTGLEVDKLNREHVKSYLDAYLQEYEDTVGAPMIGRRGLQYMLIESWEAGVQNWTEDMLKEFERRRGYDMRPWLPVLTGRVVESEEASDRLLWDFRRTIADLVVDEHYGQIADSLRRRGMGLYSEGHENSRKFVGDGMEVKKYSDVPMAAAWASSSAIQTPSTSDADIRESASVAHIYGQNLVAAESFTANGNPYGFAPEALKPLADRMLAEGVNRFVIHTSVHQPNDTLGPGIGVGPYGQWFTRHETWAEQAKPWVTYLARSSYLMQQGRAVADVAYFYGEDTNITTMYRWGLPDIPAGYNFDFVNADALTNMLSVKDGKLVTPSGMEYSVLAIDPRVRRMSLPVVRKISELVSLGAIVVGPKPLATPSLSDDVSAFKTIVDSLWEEASAARPQGVGRVFVDKSIAEVLSSIRISPDFSYTGNARLRYARRTFGQGDIYFISNADENARVIQASFRVAGKIPELWRADTGAIEPLSYRIEENRTVVPLKLQPHDAVFVVFRQPTTVRSRVVPEYEAKLLTVLEGPWDVRFPPNRGAPAHARFEKLQSWTESSDAGVKYFSGTASYSKNITVRRDWLDSRLQLDLGAVKNIAEVIVNGRSIGVVWKAPFTVDITKELKAGDNRIEVRVTNLWPNRLIGDKQPAARQIAHAVYDPFGPDSPLLPSGLLGPVTLWRTGPDCRQPALGDARDCSGE